MDTQHRVEGTRTGPFTPANRLLQRREFERVLRHGRRAVSQELLVLTVGSVQPGDRGPQRLGITVGRRVGSAVVRNRLKRRVREWFRVARWKLAAGSDVLVIARRPAARLSPRAFRDALDRGLSEVSQ